MESSERATSSSAQPQPQPQPQPFQPMDHTNNRYLQQLQEVNENLRATSKTLRQQLEQRDVQVKQLSRQLEESRNDQQMGELMLQRQLLEWQNRAQMFEQKVHVLQQQQQQQQQQQKRHSPRRQADPHLLLRLQDLESDNQNLQEQQRKQQESWEHQRSLYKREIASLEELVQELENQVEYLEARQSPETDIPNPSSLFLEEQQQPVITNHHHANLASGTTTSRRRTSLNHYHNNSNNHNLPTGASSSAAGAEMGAVYLASLQERVQKAEGMVAEKERTEIALREELLQKSLLARAAQQEAENAQERAYLLETYLEVSLSNKPGHDQELAATILQSVHRLEKKQQQRQEMERQHSHQIQQQLVEESRRQTSRQKARIDKLRAATHQEAQRQDRADLTESDWDLSLSGKYGSQEGKSPTTTKFETVVPLEEQQQQQRTEMKIQFSEGGPERVAQEESRPDSTQSMGRLAKVHAVQPHTTSDASIRDSDSVGGTRHHQPSSAPSQAVLDLHLLQERCDALESTCSHLTQEKNQLEATCQDRQAELSQLQSQLEQMKTERHVNTQIIAQLEQHCKTLETEVSQLQSQLEPMETERHVNAQIITQLEQHCMALEVEVAQLQEQTEQMQTERDVNTSQQINQLEQHCKELERQCTNLTQEKAQFENLSQDQQTELSQLQERLDQFQTERDVNTQQITQLGERCEALEIQCTNLAQEKAQLESTCQVEQAEVAKLQEQLKQIQVECTNFAQEKAQHEDIPKERHMQTEREDMSHQVAQLEERCEALEMQCTNLAHEKAQLETVSRDRQVELSQLQKRLDQFQNIPSQRTNIDSWQQPQQVESKEAEPSQSSIYDRKSQHLQETITTLQQERDDLSQRLEASQKEIADTLKRNQQLTDDYDGLRAEAQTLAELQESLEETLEDREKEMLSQRERVALLEKAVEEYLETIEGLALRNVKLLAEFKELTGRLEDKSMELADSIDMQQLLRQELKNSREAFLSLESQKNAAEEECCTLKKELERTNEGHDDEIASLLQQIDKSDEIQVELMNRLAKAESEVLEYRTRAGQLEVLQSEQKRKNRSLASVEGGEDMPLDKTAIPRDVNFTADGDDALGLPEGTDDFSEPEEWMLPINTVATDDSKPSTSQRVDQTNIIISTDDSSEPEEWMPPLAAADDLKPNDSEGMDDLSEKEEWAVIDAAGRTATGNSPELQSSKPSANDTKANDLTKIGSKILMTIDSSSDSEDSSVANAAPVVFQTPRFSLEFFKKLAADASGSSSDSGSDIDQETLEFTSGFVKSSKDEPSDMSFLSSPAKDAVVGEQVPQFSATFKSTYSSNSDSVSCVSDSQEKQGTREAAKSPSDFLAQKNDSSPSANATSSNGANGACFRPPDSSLFGNQKRIENDTPDLHSDSSCSWEAPNLSDLAEQLRSNVANFALAPRNNIIQDMTDWKLPPLVLAESTFLVGNGDRESTNSSQETGSPFEEQSIDWEEEARGLRDEVRTLERWKSEHEKEMSTTVETQQINIELREKLSHLEVVNAALNEDLNVFTSVTEDACLLVDGDDQRRQDYMISIVTTLNRSSIEALKNELDTACTALEDKRMLVVDEMQLLNDFMTAFVSNLRMNMEELVEEVNETNKPLQKDRILVDDKKEHKVDVMNKTAIVLERSSEVLKEELANACGALDEERLLLDDEEELRKDFVSNIVAIASESERFKLTLSNLMESRERDQVVEEEQQHQFSISESAFEKAEERISELLASEAKLKQELDTAYQEADEQHWRCEDSLTSLRSELAAAQSRIEELTRDLGGAKAQISDALLAKNAILEDLSAANEKIDNMATELEMTTVTLKSLASEKESYLLIADDELKRAQLTISRLENELATALKDADERQRRAEDAVASIPGNLESNQSETKNPAMDLVNSRSEIDESQRFRKALEDGLKSENAQLSRFASLETDMNDSREVVSIANVSLTNQEVKIAARELIKRNPDMKDLHSANERIEHLTAELEYRNSLLVAARKEVEEAGIERQILQENLNDVKALVEELEVENASLRQQCEDKENQLQSSTNLAEKQQEMIASASSALKEVEARVIELKAEKQMLEGQLQSTSALWGKEQARIDITTSQVHELEVQIKALQVEKQMLQEDGDRRFDAACAQLNEMERHVNELEIQIETLQADKQMLQEDGDRRFDAACAQFNEMESQVNEMQNEIVSLEKERDDLVHRVKTQQQRLDEASSQLNDVEGELLACQEEIETSELHVKALEGKLHAAKAENRSYKNHNIPKSIEENALERNLETLKNEYDSLKNEMLAKEAKLVHSEAVIRELNAREEEYIAKNMDLSGRMDILEATISLLQSAKEGLEVQLRTLEENMQTSFGDFEFSKQQLKAELEYLDSDSYRRELVSSSGHSSVTSERELMLRDLLQATKEGLAVQLRTLEDNMQTSIGDFESSKQQLKAQLEHLDSESHRQGITSSSGHSSAMSERESMLLDDVKVARESVVHQA